ncbi:MAG: ABC transporter ATP-binding protein [Deltaproteobacteria bacterium]|nr:ABC transporter ATP-binding protein [Deltaproteobacteria bacterium]
MTKLLEVEDLSLAFPVRGKWERVVENLSFSVDDEEFVGLVGESGSGKSMTALAILGLLPSPGRRVSGRILLEGEDISQLSEARLCAIRGARIGMVFQEPMTALNPVLDIGFQIAEAVRIHSKVSRREGLREAERLLEQVAMPDPGQRLRDYPHQLSGGQRQRVMIAMALASKPSLLLADEPTTALDVTIQAQILELLRQLQRDLGLAVLLISHDLAVIAETCERVLVMYAGRLVEGAKVQDLFASPAHPYTRGLLASLPRLGRPVERGRLLSIPGRVPEVGQLPSGCSFHPRCSEAFPRCGTQEPALYSLPQGGTARCFLHDVPPNGAESLGEETG